MSKMLKTMIGAWCMALVLVVSMTISAGATASDFKFTKEGGLLKYNGPGGDVVIPNGVKNADGFKDCTTLTSVIIPDSATSISGQAFKGCSNLKSVTIPSSVEYIGEYAFQNCTSLTSIIIPDRVTSIGYQAFAGCTSLKSITIPSSAIRLGVDSTTVDDADDTGIGSTTTIHGVAGSAAERYAKRKGIPFVADAVYTPTPSTQKPSTPSAGVEFAIENGVLTKYNGSGENVVIPDGVKSIGEAAFSYCEKLTNVTIPSSVTSIEDFAFGECTSLAHITIPSSVTKIHDNAFKHYSNFTTLVNLPVVIHGDAGSYAESYAKKVGISFVADGNYIPDPTVEKDFTIEKGVLKKYNGPGGDVVVPVGVRDIDDSAFRNCTSLTSVTLPDSVKTVGNYSGCTNLKSISIPDGVTKIGSFGGCTSLTSITIPGSVKTINTVSVFQGCTSLTDVTIKNGVTSIEGWSTFEGCTSLKNVTFPDSMTGIGHSVFRGCTSLESITIPNGVTLIDRNAFQDCSSLTSVTIPNSVTEIDGMAFSKCTSLKSIKIPDSVKIISGSVFSGCRSLTDIAIPASVTAIGQSAFENYNKDTKQSTVLPVTIHGVAGSYAESYAKKEGIKFVADGGNIPSTSPKPSASLAYESTQTVKVDGKAVEFKMYALKDDNGNLTNYVKVRDIAIALNGTEAQFNVSWDGAVNLVTKTSYVSNGTEMKTPFKGDREYKKVTSITKVNGKASNLEAFRLTDDNGGGYTYYKLRDLGANLSFNVGWSKEQGVFIETNKPYQE